MTIIVAMAVNPKNGEKPYILFGSDSLVVEYELIGNEKEIVGRNENQQKIFVVHNKLVSFMGVFNADLIFDLLEYLENNTTVETAIEDIVEIAKDYILERGDLVTENITVLFGQISNNGNPVLARIELGKELYKEAEIEFIKVNYSPDYQFTVSGPDHPPRELVELFQDEIEMNDSINVVKKSAENFLKQLANLYPETCNQNIKIECLM